MKEMTNILVKQDIVWATWAPDHALAVEWKWDESSTGCRDISLVISYSHGPRQLYQSLVNCLQYILFYMELSGVPIGIMLNTQYFRSSIHIYFSDIKFILPRPTLCAYLVPHFGWTESVHSLMSLPPCYNAEHSILQEFYTHLFLYIKSMS